MPKPSVIVCFVLLAVSALGLYYVKYQVQRMKVELAELKRGIEDEKAALHVLKAEWAYLSRPERIQALAGRHLRLAPITVEQIANVEQVPFPPFKPTPPGGKPTPPNHVASADPWGSAQ